MINLKIFVGNEKEFFGSRCELGGPGERVVKERVRLPTDGEDEPIGDSPIFGDEVSFAHGGEIESEFTFAKPVAGDDSAVGAGSNVGFVTGERVARDHAVEGVDGKSGIGLVFEDVVEALETAGLIDLEGGAIFLEITSGDASRLIQGGNIGGSAIVDADFAAT